MTLDDRILHKLVLQEKFQNPKLKNVSQEKFQYPKLKNLQPKNSKNFSQEKFQKCCGEEKLYSPKDRCVIHTVYVIQSQIISQSNLEIQKNRYVCVSQL